MECHSLRTKAHCLNCHTRLGVGQSLTPLVLHPIELTPAQGSDASIEAMSGRLGMNKCRLTSLNRLSYLAPEIVGAVLAGRHPIELTPTRLLRLSKNLPPDWMEQRRFLGLAA